MDRNVVKIRSNIRAGGDGDEPPPQQKLLKYFPAEALTLYITLDGLFRAGVHGTALNWALWACLILSVLFCILFLRRFWQIEHRGQLSISTLALALYVAAIGGPFGTLGWYRPVFGVIAAVVATAFIIFVPSQSLPAPPAERARNAF